MRWPAVLPVAVLLLSGIATGQETPDQANSLSALTEEIRRFAQIYALLEENAAEKIDAKAAFESGALPGAMRRLDPHSVFFNQDQFDQLREMQTSTRKGFGSVVSVLPGRVIILQTMPGSPSERAGLSPGDEILAINNIPLSRFDMDQMVEYLAYTRQREAILAVRRENFPRLLEFRLSPASLDSPSVERAFLLPGGTGYIRVASFEAKTGRDFAKAVENLGGNKLPGLIIDLRTNTGGVFASAIEMASLFLPEGAAIASIRGRARAEETLTAAPELAGRYQFPLAVLVSGKTASASEVFSAAMQENQRGKLIGEKTYGKGLVQGVFPLSGGAGMALTTAYYYTPGGRSLQRKLEASQIDPNLNPGGAGLEPDVEAGPEAPTRLRVFLDQSAAITAYAAEWARKNPKPGADWALPLTELDRFRVWLGEKNVFPSLGEWNFDSRWIQQRLEQEILNLSVSVERGDEVEIRHDPVVRTALLHLQR
jgi:carboxyl-terminal processing protease